MSKVFTLGYAQPGAAQRLEELMRDPSTLLIDTRMSPRTSYKAWGIESLISQWGERYRWAGERLGNINYKNGGPITIADPIRGVNGLLYYLSRGHSIVLLCGCKEYRECHRSHIVEVLKAGIVKASLDVEIVPEATTEMLKCLSIRPPYAQWIVMTEQFVAAGLSPKKIENRDWKISYRGPLLIHASKKFEEDALWHWARRIPYLGEAVSMSEDTYEKGQIVGIADLVDVVDDSDDPWFVGTYGWVFANARPLKYPIPYRGALKLFEVPFDAVKNVLPEGALA